MMAVQKTQKRRATMPLQQRTQTMLLLLLIPRRRLQRQHHPNRIKTTTTSCSRPSRISTRSSRRYMLRYRSERPFSFFRDIAIRAPCLCSLLGARSTRRVGTRIRMRCMILRLVLRERTTPHRCGGARLTIGRSRRRLRARGWDCCLLASSRDSALL